MLRPRVREPSLDLDPNGDDGGFGAVVAAAHAVRAQVVAAYSVRSLPGAPVATPFRWNEVTVEALLHGRRRLDSALELLAKRTRRA